MNCPIHGANPRPELCNDCGRHNQTGARRLQIQDVDRNRILLRKIGPRGVVRAEVVGAPLPMHPEMVFWD